MSKRMRPHKFDIVGHPWKIYFQPKEVFLEMHGKGVAAITVTDERKMFFNIEDVTLETIRHELVHAYVVMFNFVELDLDDDQTEEFFAELIGKYGEIICKQAKDIIKLATKKTKK